MTYEEKLLQLCEKDERIFVLTAENRSLIRGLPPKLGDRFVDTGITEQTMIGMASGLALRGSIPIAHALATFLTLRAYEFIRTDTGIGKLPVKLVGSVPGFLSDGNGPTHQAVDDIAVLRTIPGMRIFSAADAQEAADGLEEFIYYQGPAYLRYNVRPPAYAHASSFVWGKSERMSEGKDVTILTHGTLVTEGWQAKQLLESEGLSVGFVNLRSLQPLDEKVILESVAQSKFVVTLEDHFIKGGLYTLVCEILVQNQKMAKVLPLALDAQWFKPGLLSEVLEYEGFTPRKIADRIKAYAPLKKEGHSYERKSIESGSELSSH